MANERLRTALLERGTTVAELAEAIEVDAKTVERWITQDTGLMRLFADKAKAGVRVRILLGDPDSPEVAQRGADEGIGHYLAGTTGPHIG